MNLSKRGDQGSLNLSVEVGSKVAIELERKVDTKKMVIKAMARVQRRMESLIIPKIESRAKEKKGQRLNMPRKSVKIDKSDMAFYL